MATPDYVLQEMFEFKVSYHEKVRHLHRGPLLGL